MPGALRVRMYSALVEKGLPLSTSSMNVAPGESLLNVTVLRQRVLRPMPMNEAQEIVNKAGQ